MKIVDIYSILSIRESHTRCKMPDKYYLECNTDKKLYLCYGDINEQNNIYGIELQEFGYKALISEIKNVVTIIEKWRLSDLQKSIDTIAELGLTSLPNKNNKPRLCR